MERKKRSGKCGWCLTGDCDRCRPEVRYEDKVWVCDCEHRPRPVSQAEWLGYERDVDGRPG